MKSTIQGSTNKYPYIGICNLGIVILFTAPNTGVVLYQENAKLGGNKEIGEFSYTIHESNFRIYNGIITLSN